ncbi:TetR/AcrR family transcriptional regulator [Arvimicrobium flavum]|uniref:TetR/AcrR family transcriptional regulator n=1 Tax=Arvimicrobium flavum TaxID=3393320 RepID=UPI00237ACAB3|nr:TetR/AcrR family transcriptional regulator [Mesorhizobium shangrilense]
MTADALETGSVEEAKRTRVLDGAMKVVLAYGYHRTTMDDIARAAEMSRPALYLLFRNKADIYRAIAGRMFEQCTRHIAEVLAGPGTLGERLASAIEFKMIDMMCPIETSPHGAELLDLKGQLAGDLVETWKKALAQLFCDAITAETRRTHVVLKERGLCAEMLAEFLVDGLEGMKMRAPDMERQRNAVGQLVRVIELAIKP